MVAALAAVGILGVRRLQRSTVARPGVFVPAAMAVALAPLPDGGLLYGEQRSGRVFDIGPDGTGRGLVAEVDVATNGDRGLLGLAVDPSGRQRYASWVAPDGRFRVGELTPGGVVVVWEGPITGEAANGGYIAWTPSGRILFGEGGRPEGGLGGRLVQLDPRGAPLQVPQVLSSGWIDPYAFTYDDAGRLWVADAPPAAGVRVSRGDVDGRPTDSAAWGEAVAPAGLAAAGAEELVLCGSTSGTVQRISTAGGRPTLAQDGVAPCRHGVAVLADGRWAVALEAGIRIQDPPPAGVGS